MRTASALLTFVSVLLAGAFASGPARADWPDFGRALCTAPGLQGAQAIASDGANGAIVTWHDRRTFPFNIYAQHLLASGEVDAAWPDNGRALLPDALVATIVPQGKEFPAIVSDGAGGAIVTWPDGRSSITGLDIFVQHVLASGAVDPAWPVNGTTVSAAAGEQLDPVILSDGAGGAIVAWVDGRLGPTVNDLDVYAQHVLASGLVDPNWPANGAPLCTAPNAQVGLAVLEDGAGGAIVTWSDLRSGNPGIDIYAQRVLSSGVVDAAWPVNGRGLCTAPGTQSGPRIASDGAQGAIVTWTDTRDGTNDIYAQRVLPSGAIAAGWPVNGRAVSNTGSDEVGPDLASDGAGGAIVTWGDDRSTGFHDIRAQHVLGSSALDVAWPVDGAALNNTASGATSQTIVADGAGGAIVAWQVGFDVVAQHVLASGALDPTFSPNGRPLVNLPSLQENPEMVGAGAAGPIVVWRDNRGGDDFDLYGLRVFAAGTVGAGDPPATRAITFAPPSPSPATGPVTLRFALPHAAVASLAIFDLAGRRVRELAGGNQAAGEHTAAWDLRDDAGHTVRPGLYFARLEAENRVLTRKVSRL